MCGDCLQYVANGEVPEDRPELPAQVAAQWEELEQHMCCGSSEDDEEFSTAPCDGCGSSLAGDRYGLVVLCDHPGCAS